jgi:hypothetical protein
MTLMTLMTLATGIRLDFLLQRAAALWQVCACVDSATSRRPIRLEASLESCPSSRSLTLEQRSSASIPLPVTVSATIPLRYKTHGVAASSN